MELPREARRGGDYSELEVGVQFLVEEHLLKHEVVEEEEGLLLAALSVHLIQKLIELTSG